MAQHSESTLKVGKKGEIFTSAELRKRISIKEGGKVKATVVGNKLVIEAVPSIEDILKMPPIIRTTTKETERVSEKIQKEQGIYGA
jgi:bifunctional DNA-binding transcriptional regulator/antitoxin component of YhaV-PrlF toxin-antitoxin module